jgi:hypothetical protein
MKNGIDTIWKQIEILIIAIVNVQKLLNFPDMAIGCDHELLD